MLRGLALVLLASPVFGLGVDDTEKRRSEEILRAVAAAATADYEGLQQMKLQKSRTFTTITAAERTKECVQNLIAAMEAENRSLQDAVDDASTDAATTSGAIDKERDALKAAIQAAIQDVYKEIQRRYTELSEHSLGMMDALNQEVTSRTTEIDAQGTPEKLFQAIINHAAVQLNAARYTHPGDEGDATGLDPATVQQHLAEMMLHEAIVGVHKKDDTLEGVSQDYVNMKNILLFAGASEVDTDFDPPVVTRQDPTGVKYGWWGTTPTLGDDSTFTILLKVRSGELMTFFQDPCPPGSQSFKCASAEESTDGFDYSADDKKCPLVILGDGCSACSGCIEAAEGGPAPDFTPPGRAPSTFVKMFQMNMTALERKNLQNLEKEFVEWTVAKSNFHNVSTKKSAVDAAVGMLGAKLEAIKAAKAHINVYSVELGSLEDDEMRRIADIKEEFESLAADWLQLATYHCCDIVQGNTVECKDATDHLMQPINNVFPGALKAPEPARDCVRRLL